MQMSDQRRRIEELELQLSNERVQVHSNNMAYEILQKFIDGGDAVQLDHGEVHLNKSKSSMANTISNVVDLADEFDDHM